ncbi:hypothetical protein [Finch poxvirus]|uniref:Uncharacterized protein n=2 Tax=unclassified Avipoxvirus TaxID=336487 RepID=A0AAT9UPV6_9POXV|nr:hypothetical protein [Finch poxvirus]UOX38937.1 hypothetical protein [Finch poxvirus]
MKRISSLLLLLICITCSVTSKPSRPVCPRRMFNPRRGAGPVVSMVAPDGDPTSSVVALNNWHRNTSCKYNTYCTFFDFCFAGAVNISFGRQKIELVYYFYVKAVTRDDYNKITQEITLKHMDDIRVKPLTVSFMPLNTTKVKIPSSHECMMNKVVDKPVIDVCGDDNARNKKAEWLQAKNNMGKGRNRG